MFSESSVVVLKDNEWLEKQRIAGSVVAECLACSKSLIENKTKDLTTKIIEKECESIIQKNKCIPTFKNYKGFPNAICASVNKQLVHGFPSNNKLKEGDIVKIDVGATYDGAIGDAAITSIYGNPIDPKHQKIVDVCKEALYKGIESISVGKQIGMIGYTIHNYVKKQGCRVITSHGGHGIGIGVLKGTGDTQLHASPFIANKSKKNEGIRIQPGMSITLEPMVTCGSDKTKVDKNGWTVVTKEVNSHAEHSIFIHEDRVEILTNHENRI